MASQTDAPSARAAAAEARRRRLLARGGERLSSITVGVKTRQDTSDAGQSPRFAPAAWLDLCNISKHSSIY